MVQYLLLQRQTPQSSQYRTGEEKPTPSSPSAEPLATHLYTAVAWCRYWLSLSCSEIRLVWPKGNQNDCMENLRLKNQ